MLPCAYGERRAESVTRPPYDNFKAQILAGKLPATTGQALAFASVVVNASPVMAMENTDISKG